MGDGKGGGAERGGGRRENGGRQRGACGMSCGTREGPSLPGLRCRAVVVPSSLRTRNHHAATVAGARHVPVGRTVLVESVCRQGGTHSGAVPTGRGSKGVAPQRGWHSSQRPHTFKKSGMALPATLSLTRAHHRDCGGRAARSHVYLRHSATACGLELAHALLLAYTLIHWIVITCECEIGLAAGS